MNLKHFFIALAVSFPLWWGANIFQKNSQDFFLWQIIKADPELFLAEAQAPVVRRSPAISRNPGEKSIVPEDFSASAAFAVWVDNNGRRKTLFQKNADGKFPIASVSKLMVADIILNNYDLSRIVEIDEAAVAREEDFGSLKAGERLSVKNLLYLILMESSNDAVWALAEQEGIDNFVLEMNRQAGESGLADTYFINPNGVDPDIPNGPLNYSTARDLSRLAQTLYEKKPLVWDILGLSAYDLYMPDGKLHHRLKNTNELLGMVPRLIGGKTGWTPIAKGCLVLLQRAPGNQGFLVYVLLGSDDRFGEMAKLVNWADRAWSWQE